MFEFASAVDAVSFAVDVQDAMMERNRGAPDGRRIDYRIGINIGDIIIEPEDIYGDGVNIAARLEALAEPGGICIARNVLYGLAGQLENAKTHAAEVRRINPGFGLAKAPAFYVTANPEFLERFLSGLRATGLPE